MNAEKQDALWRELDGMDPGDIPDAVVMVLCRILDDPSIGGGPLTELGRSVMARHHRALALAGVVTGEWACPDSMPGNGGRVRRHRPPHA